MRPRLSLCMIVRDEMAMLGGCLDSVAGLVDEICIVDTGSTDGTLDLVAQRAHSVRRIPWPGDFAAARNESLALANGEWILVLDADERLRAEARALDAALARRRALAFELGLRNQLSAGRVVRHRAVRLFRRNGAIRFEGAVHEHVGGSLREIARREPLWLVEPLDHVEIDHLGYDPDLRDQAPKRRRNLELLHRALEADPEDAYLRYKLSRELSASEGSPRHLARAARALLARPRSALWGLPWAAEALAVASLAWSDEGQAGVARQAARRALEVGGEHPVSRFALARSLRAGGDVPGAIAELRRALAATPPARGYDFDHEAQDLRARLLLAELLGEHGAGDESVNVLAEARVMHPSHPAAAHALARGHLAAGRAPAALAAGVSWLRQQPGDGVMLQICARAAEELGRHADASRLRERAESFSAASA